MSNGSYSLAELLKELQPAEGIIGHKGNVQVMEKYSSFYSKKGKKKKNTPKLGAQSKKKPKVSEGMSKGKCFTYGQKGHQKKYWPKNACTQNGNSLRMPLA